MAENHAICKYPPICIKKGVQPAPYSSMNELLLRDQQLHSNTDDVGGQAITFPNLCVQISVFTGFFQQSVFMQDISHTQQLFFLFPSVEFSNLQSEVFFIMAFLPVCYQDQGYIYPIPLPIIPFQNVSSGCWFLLLYFFMQSTSFSYHPKGSQAARRIPDSIFVWGGGVNLNISMRCCRSCFQGRILSQF